MTEWPLLIAASGGLTGVVTALFAAVRAWLGQRRDRHTLITIHEASGRTATVDLRTKADVDRVIAILRDASERTAEVEEAASQEQRDTPDGT